MEFFDSAEEKGCHSLARKSTLDLHFPSSASGVWLPLMPNLDYQKGKTHQEGRKGRGKVMQKICERVMQLTQVYVFPAQCFSPFTGNISNKLEEETFLSTWNVLLKRTRSPFAVLGSCTSPSVKGLFSSLREQQPDARVCKENSCLSAQQLPAELLSHTFSLHWVHTAPTQSTCHFIWDGWEERKRGEGRKNVRVHPGTLLWYHGVTYKSKPASC